MSERNAPPALTPPELLESFIRANLQIMDVFWGGAASALTPQADESTGAPEGLPLSHPLTPPAVILIAPFSVNVFNITLPPSAYPMTELMRHYQNFLLNVWGLRK